MAEQLRAPEDPSSITSTLGIEVRDNYEPMNWDLNQSPLQEWPVLLAIEPFLQSPKNNNIETKLNPQEVSTIAHTCNLITWEAEVR